MLTYLAVFLALAAVWLLWQSSRQRKEAGLPGGRVIYTDTRAWGPVEKPLFDARLNLTGKPDYLVEQDGHIIPVEVKTGRTPEAPRDAHVFQLAAYCLLVERTYGVRPTHGILHYPDRTFAIDYSAELESALLDLLADMRIQERQGEADRSHEDSGRCARCGYRKHCDQRLV